MSIYHNQGEMAAMMGYEQHENPYPQGTQEYEDWDEGWWFADDDVGGFFD